MTDRPGGAWLVRQGALVVSLLAGVLVCVLVAEPWGGGRQQLVLGLVVGAGAAWLLRVSVLPALLQGAGPQQAQASPEGSTAGLGVRRVLKADGLPYVVWNQHILVRAVGTPTPRQLQNEQWERRSARRGVLAGLMLVGAGPGLLPFPFNALALLLGVIVVLASVWVLLWGWADDSKRAWRRDVLGIAVDGTVTQQCVLVLEPAGEGALRLRVEWPQVRYGATFGPPPPPLAAHAGALDFAKLRSFQPSTMHALFRGRGIQDETADDDAIIAMMTDGAWLLVARGGTATGAEMDALRGVFAEVFGDMEAHAARRGELLEIVRQQGGDGPKRPDRLPQLD